MLPLIVIGADERTTAAFQQCPVPIQPCRFYEDTEAAAYELNDAMRTAIADGYPGPGLVQFDASRNAWRANVAYGPKALGLAVTGQPVKLPHTGWTLALVWSPVDPAASRRVVGGAPEGRDQTTLAWQAAVMVAAHVIIDLAVPASDGTPYPGLVAILGQMTQKVEP